MKKTSIRIILVLLVIVLIAWLILRKTNSKAGDSNGKDKPKTKVDALVVRPSLLIDDISISGSLLAFEEVELRNEVAGRVVFINLPEGKFVKAGTLLIKLFDDDLQANLKKLQAQLAIQQKIYQRQEELLKVNGISQNEFDQTGLQVNSIQADIDIQKAQIRKTEILAPFDGIIGLRNISLGAEVTPSTLLATIREQDKLKLDFSVPEKYSPLIKPGLDVKFSLSNDDIQYDATVMATEQGIDANTRNLKVRAYVNSHKDHLIPGAYVNVYLRLSENPNALLIPTQAIIPSEEDKMVIVARKGKAHLTKVKTGMRESSKIEITDGIQAGDTIITSGLLFIKEGAKLFYSTVKSDTL